MGNAIGGTSRREILLNATGFATVAALGTLNVRARPAPVPRPANRPNIVFILADNLGWGEISAYGGGATRGAPPPRIDSLAAEGTRLTNMNMETQCTPSRSSILTGRFAIRSGTYAVPFGGVPEGLTQWKVTMAEAMSAAGYATGCFGKWHLGSHDGRLPNDQGFDEWFGIPRTTDEALWPGSPGYSPSISPPEMVMEGRVGEQSRSLTVYDVTQRRLIDAEITRRSVAFIEDRARQQKPFYAYVSLTQPHLPTLPNPTFAGRTGNGDWADMLAEMDRNVGRLLDAVDRAGVRDDTVIVFTSDNGAEYIRPWDGWAGPWRGAYFTALEGGIRVPFLIRWPQRIPAGRVSNEVVHGVDLFPTFASLAGAAEPGDRIIDGVDQSRFLLGASETSTRECFPIRCADRLTAVKWRNWKLHFFRQDTMFDPPVRLPVPTIYNLYTDPREEKPATDTWVVRPMLQIVADFDASTRRHPLIPMGTSDPYVAPARQ
jgi:arylsulfatase